ncbi:MAG: hypothetical protein ACI9YE_001758 [Psychroserpens sp.]|jgi:hypothetical protein
MDNLLIDLKTTPTKEIVEEIINNYFTAFFVGRKEGTGNVDAMEISILTVMKELEDDSKFIATIMFLARTGKERIKDYYWIKLRELCTEQVQQAKEDYYYE